ncbi:MAG: DUF1501 domain-containing protein [Pirellulaceae bacterium]|nr:DUF1501 domain-containing protein [Pirellulaceae bacterium]
MTLNRRNFIGRSSALGFSSLLGGRIHQSLAAGDPAGRFRRCVVLWMGGGPSQLDTFDPKPGSPRKSIATAVSDIRFAETLPGLAARADSLCVVRSIGSGEGEHARATELLHTGFSPMPSFPRPPIGSFLSQARDDPGFPRYVTLGGTGFGPAFLGNDHGPFVIEDVQAAKQQLDRVAQNRRALDLISKFNADYSATTFAAAVSQRSARIASVRKLLQTPFPDALDLKSVKNTDRERYGDDPFGQRALTALRLLKLGVPFVEVQLGNWDTHVDNMRRTDRLCRQLERPWLALMDDLQASGLWDDTLLVWMGEFGRTPQVNGNGGRDHFPETTPVVLAGGKLGGKVVGATSPNGTRRLGSQHTIADLVATIATLLGLDVDQVYETDFGSPTTLTDGGQPIDQIVSVA